MTPARVGLADLIAEGSLERVTVDAETCSHLMTQARNHLRTAAAGLQIVDTEGAFQLAYDACRKACLGLILAMGLRPRGEAHHAVTFKAAAAIAHTFGGHQIVNDASHLRFIRHGAEYRAETVSLEDAQDAIDTGTELIDLLEPKIQQILTNS